MRLAEIIDFEAQKRNIERMNQRAKQQTVYANSAQAWFEMQRARANEQKARQRFIQAAQAFSRSSHP
jgi:outer membrane protein TolC